MAVSCRWFPHNNSRVESPGVCCRHHHNFTSETNDARFLYIAYVALQIIEVSSVHRVLEASLAGDARMPFPAAEKQQLSEMRSLLFSRYCTREP